MILIRPILSEKSVKGAESAKFPRYTFEVHMDATKWDISEEIEKIYDVKVADVKTMVVRGKERTRHSKRGSTHGKSSNYKKAVVILKDGYTIDYYQTL